MTMADIVIWEPIGWIGRWDDFLAKLRGHKAGYRGKGLGTQLLKLMINHTKAIGVREISGYIRHTDASEGLIKMYQSVGFTVIPSDVLPDGDTSNVGDLYMEPN